MQQSTSYCCCVTSDSEQQACVDINPASLQEIAAIDGQQPIEKNANIEQSADMELQLHVAEQQDGKFHASAEHDAKAMALRSQHDQGGACGGQDAALQNGALLGEVVASIEAGKMERAGDEMVQPNTTEGDVAAISKPVEVAVHNRADDERVQHLEAAKRGGRNVRLRICVPCVIVGVLLLIIGTAGIFVGLRSENRFVMPVGFLVSFSGLVALLLAVLPTDRRLTRGVTIAVCILSGIMILVILRVIMRTSNDPRDGCASFCRDATVGGMGFMFIIVACGVITLVSSVVKLEAGELLERTWRALSVMISAQALVSLFHLVANTSGVSYDGDNDVFKIRQAIFVVGFTFFGCVMAQPNFRGRAQAWLASRGEGIRAAAAIAVMLGGYNVETVIEMGRDKFHCISCDVLTLEMLKDSKPNPALYNLSQKAKLGEVDAFLSHSWTDSPVAKWNAIQHWRQSFKKKYGREPTLWIDKFCLDQTAIDINLLCLPVFLTGTKKLLVIAGPSYLQRLWCIIEIFTFIQMGGNRERLEMRILEENDEAGVTTPAQQAVDRQPSGRFSQSATTSSSMSVVKQRGLFANFDAKDATCYHKADRDRLISVVETGCGGLAKFNETVRTMLLQASDRKSVTGGMSDGACTPETLRVSARPTSTSTP